ncbi:MAG TPA: S49 family peptidase [Verrucomicrobiota bacterium]|nr:S49 family peptidase [Verrucomicrobiota bacterium]
MLYPHLAGRLFGVPLLIHRPKLDVILSVLAPRLGLDGTLPQAALPSPRPVASPTPGIAILPIHGSLVRRTLGMEAESGLLSYQAIQSGLGAALADPNVAGILLDVDSPGGEAGGVFDLADRIAAAAKVKPIWAIANESAFSAAYALASAASRLVVTRTSGIGSVGVIAMHIDQSGMDAKAGLQYTPIVAGAHKNDLSPHTAITDEARAMLQAEVDRLYGLFIDTVASHGRLSADALRATEAGLYFGDAAVAAGLADAVATFDDTLAEMADFLTPRTVQRLAAARTDVVVLPTSCSEKDTPMTQPEPHTDTPEVPATPATPAAIQQMTMSYADAVEVAELCQLAGVPERTASYLSAQTPVANVRRTLLALRADGPEIASHLTPEAMAAKPEALKDNPLIAQARARAGKD